MLKIKIKRNGSIALSVAFDFFCLTYSLQIEVQRLQQVVRIVFFGQLEELAFHGCERSCVVPVVGEVLFVLSALGVGCMLFEVTPDVGRGVFGVPGAEFFSESGIDQTV